MWFRLMGKILFARQANTRKTCFPKKQKKSTQMSVVQIKIHVSNVTFSEQHTSDEHTHKF